jgi:hypothetical protein
MCQPQIPDVNAWLNQLPRDATEKLAFRNDPGLIGNP